MTLRELVALHPEWLDLPMAILLGDASGYAWVKPNNGTVYVAWPTDDSDLPGQTLVFCE